MVGVSRAGSPAFALVRPLTRNVRAIPRQARCSRRRNAATPIRSAVQSPLPATSFRLAPSDFAFLWEECKRCFYLKIHKKLYRPRAPFPSIFGAIDLGMKRHFGGLRTTDIFPDSIGPGTFLCEDDDAWVECLPITPPGHTHSVYIRGMVDGIVRFDDGTFGIVDFKTSSAARSGGTYARQLHAYARALEQPSPNSELVQGEVSDMGLVVYTPDAFHTPHLEGKLVAAMTGQLSYVQIERDDASFDEFLGSVLDVLTAPAPPPCSPKCSYCTFLKKARAGGWIPK